jgi:hypothetical protein
VADSGATRGGPPSHVDHDPALIVALLDRDLAGADRVVAEALLRDCAACAELHDDLLALAKASRELATPSRPRDFALTQEVAAMLRPVTAGEPESGRARLTGEMTERRSAHTAHDRLLIANLVSRSVSDAERVLAEEQLTACRDCAQLLDDLVALSAATRAMPVPSRPREFILTTADAERLRVRGWRRLLSAIGSSRDVFSRPLAIGLTTLGLAGLLVATIPGSLPGFGGGATRLQAPEDATRNLAGDPAAGSAANPELQSEASPASSAAAESGPAIAAAAPSAAPSNVPAPAPASSGTPPEVLAEGGESGPLAGEPQDRGAFDTYQNSFSDAGGGGPSPVLIVAALLLLVGLGLFGLRWTARRLGDG